MATQLLVTLDQHGDRCALIIENDGDLLDPLALETTSQQLQRGDYGTKRLTTIAAELPNGVLQPHHTSNWGLPLELTWILS